MDKIYISAYADGDFSTMSHARASELMDTYDRKGTLSKRSGDAVIYNEIDSHVRRAKEAVGQVDKAKNTATTIINGQLTALRSIEKGKESEYGIRNRVKEAINEVSAMLSNL